MGSSDVFSSKTRTRLALLKAQSHCMCISHLSSLSLGSETDNSSSYLEEHNLAPGDPPIPTTVRSVHKKRKISSQIYESQDKSSVRTHLIIFLPICHGTQLVTYAHHKLNRLPTSEPSRADQELRPAHEVAAKKKET